MRKSDHLMSTEIDVPRMEDDVIVCVADALREELLGAVSCFDIDQGRFPSPSSSNQINCSSMWLTVADLNAGVHLSAAARHEIRT